MGVVQQYSEMVYFSGYFDLLDTHFSATSAILLVVVWRLGTRLKKCELLEAPRASEARIETVHCTDAESRMRMRSERAPAKCLAFAGGGGRAGEMRTAATTTSARCAANGLGGINGGIYGGGGSLDFSRNGRKCCQPERRKCSSAAKIMRASLAKML